MLWFRLFGGMLPVKDFKETEPAQRRSRGRVWWNVGGVGGDSAGAGGQVQAPGADGAGRGEAGKAWGEERRPVAGVVPPAAKLCPLWPQRWLPPAASRRVAFILEVLV